MGWIYPGSMANLDFETRVLDCEIRLLIGLPMADTAAGFLGGFAEEVTNRDEEITNLNQRIEDLEKESSRDLDEIKELRNELRLAKAEIDRLTKKE